MLVAFHFSESWREYSRDIISEAPFRVETEREDEKGGIQKNDARTVSNDNENVTVQRSASFCPRRHCLLSWTFCGS